MAKISDAKMKKVMDVYRKEYPKHDLYFTEDGNCFLKKNMAEAHARKEKIKVIESLVKKEATKADDTKMTEDEAKEKLAALTLDKDSDHKLLGEIIDILGIECKGNSKNDRIAALKPVQDDLKAE